MEADDGVSTKDPVELLAAVAPTEEMDVAEVDKSSEMNTEPDVVEKESLRMDLVQICLELHKKNTPSATDIEDSLEVDEGYKTFQEDLEVPEADSSIAMDCTSVREPLDHFLTGQTQKGTRLGHVSTSKFLHLP